MDTNMTETLNENWIEGFAKQAADLGFTQEQTEVLLTKTAHLTLYNSSEDFREGFDKEAVNWAGVKSFLTRVNNFGRKVAPTAAKGVEEAAPAAAQAAGQIAPAAAQAAPGVPGLFKSLLGLGLAGTKTTGALIPKLPGLVAGGALWGGGNYLYDQGKEFMDTLHLTPQQAEWRRQMKALNDSSIPVEQQVLAADTLKKNIARSLADQARAFGHRTSSSFEAPPPWWERDR